MDYSEIMRLKGTTNCPVAKFKELASRNFTFVDSWDDNRISSSTFRVYSKKVPVAQAERDFVSKVRSEYRTRPNQLIEKTAIDSFKMNGALSSFMVAPQEITDKISEKTKPAERLCFFKGAIFECTTNDLKRNTYMTSDPVLLYELPNEEDLLRWKKIKVLKCPPGCKEFIFDMDQEKQVFIDLGFVEIEISTAPEFNIALPMMQCIRKQYCLRHRITGTIHAAMGDTYESMASCVSLSDPHYQLWDRGQLVVIISRTKCPSKTIFVGNKAETLDALCQILTKKTQWTDYISQILNIITINEDERHERVMTQENFPFRVSDLRLPEVDTGIVYMLNSMRRRAFVYIGKTNQPRRRLNNHNSGFGSSSTEPAHLRPYAIMAYISGFDGNNELMLACEEKWKHIRNNMIRDGIYDAKTWAKGGQQIINNANLQITYSVKSYDLRLVLLFQD
jgi:predicted GIY-YIG superfamily endonuclease